MTNKIVYVLLFLVCSISSVYANDIYITQSGNNLNLDITQDGQDNVAGNSSTAISLTGNSMTFNIDQVGNSNVVSTVINGTTYTGNIDLTGNSNTVALTCASSNCETVSMSIDVVGDDATVTVAIGDSASSANFVGTIDLATSNEDTITLTVNAANADADIDMDNDALGSSVDNTANYTMSGAGDSAGHSLTHNHTGEGTTVDITQSGIYDNKIQLTTVGDNSDIDIIQSD